MMVSPIPKTFFNEVSFGYHDIEVTNHSQLNSHITLEGERLLYTDIDVSNGGVINADIIANNTNGKSRVNIVDPKQPNQFTLHNNEPIHVSGTTVLNSFGVNIQSSDANYQIFNNGKYGEFLGGGANTSSYSNPNIINLTHYFYGDSKANVRWLDSDITGDIVLSDNAYAYYDAYLRARFTGTITLHDTSTFDFVFLPPVMGEEVHRL